MAGRTTISRGIRLPKPLWKQIDDEAEALGMSRNELLARRLRQGFSFANADRKPANNSHIPGNEEVVDLPL